MNAIDTVTKDRHLFVGGSDIGKILNVSSYGSRWDLLMEKLGIISNEFKGNQYTEYGNTMEPLILEYINQNKMPNGFVIDFEPRVLVNENEKVRCNVDGFTDNANDERCILEIKTARDVIGALNNKSYLAQLLMYMTYYNADKGLLAVYENVDFSEVFNPSQLTVRELSKEDLIKILNVDIKSEVKKFWQDMDTLQAYHDLGFDLDQSMITDNNIQALSDKVITIENEIAQVKEKEKQLKEFKEQLLNAMKENHIKKWETPNGVKITVVEKAESIKQVLNEELVKKELGDKYNNFLIDKVTKGSTYLKITLPKV